MPYKNPEDRKKYAAAYRKKHKAKLSVYDKEYRVKNRQLLKEYDSLRYVSNRRNILKRQKEYDKKTARMKAVRSRQYREHRAEQLKKYYQNWRKKNTAKIIAYNSKLSTKRKNNARAALRKAVYKCKILKTPCEVCGDLKVEAHHYKGYSKKHRFTVKWLCRKCHMKEHRKYN